MSGDTLHGDYPRLFLSCSNRRAPLCWSANRGLLGEATPSAQGAPRRCDGAPIHLSAGRWLLAADDTASSAGPVRQRRCRRRANAHRSTQGRPRRLCLRRRVRPCESGRGDPEGWRYAFYGFARSRRSDPKGLCLHQGLHSWSRERCAEQHNVRRGGFDIFSQAAEAGWPRRVSRSQEHGRPQFFTSCACRTDCVGHPSVR